MGWREGGRGGFRACMRSVEYVQDNTEARGATDLHFCSKGMCEWLETDVRPVNLEVLQLGRKIPLHSGDVTPAGSV